MGEERGEHGEVTRGPAWSGSGQDVQSKGRQVDGEVEGRCRDAPEQQARAEVDLVQAKMQHGHKYRCCPQGVC
jgi:hypothetical protein